MPLPGLAEVWLQAVFADAHAPPRGWRFVTVESDHAIRATLALLAMREPGATICPSEVARSLGTDGEGGSTDGWREWMPAVHAAVDELVAGRRIRLSWKGETLAERGGPYRIGRGPRGWRMGP